MPTYIWGIIYRVDFEYYTFQYTDTREKKKKFEPEDYLRATDNVFVICDGVFLLHQDPYPTPSPAARAAKIAGDTIVEGITHEQARAPQELLRYAGEQANLAVREYNESIGVTKKTLDYIKVQYAATVFAYGFIKDATFYFAQLNDCGVMLLDPLGNQELDIITNSQPYIDLITSKEKQGVFAPGSQEEHVYVRKDVVNNPNADINGAYVNFGVLNGEPEALQFIRYGSITPTRNQTIFLYSDGFIPYVYDPEFKRVAKEFDHDAIEHFISNKMLTEKDSYKKEKSLIIIKTR